MQNSQVLTFFFCWIFSFCCTQDYTLNLPEPRLKNHLGSRLNFKSSLVADRFVMTCSGSMLAVSEWEPPTPKNGKSEPAHSTRPFQPPKGTRLPTQPVSRQAAPAAPTGPAPRRPCRQRANFKAVGTYTRPVSVRPWKSLTPTHFGDFEVHWSTTWCDSDIFWIKSLVEMHWSTTFLRMDIWSQSCVLLVFVFRQGQRSLSFSDI